MLKRGADDRERADHACEVSVVEGQLSSESPEVNLRDVRSLRRGGATVVDRLPWWDASTPVLHRWSHGTLECTLTGATILCRNGDTAISVAVDGFAVAG